MESMTTLGIGYDTKPIIETAYFMRMEANKDLGLFLESSYADYYLDMNRKYGTKFPENADERQVLYAGAHLAHLYLNDYLALNKVSIFDRYETHHLCFLAKTMDHAQFIEWVNRVASDENTLWVKTPGFGSVNTIAWLIPSANPVLLFRPTIKNLSNIEKCRNYNSCVDWIERYVNKLTNREIILEDIPYIGL